MPESESSSAGGVVTETLAVASRVPPAPVHDSVKLVLAVSDATVSEPLMGFVPLHPPVAEQDVAFDALHVSTAEPPLFTDVALTLSDTVGGCAELATETVTLRAAEPPAPVQDNV